MTLALLLFSVCIVNVSGKPFFALGGLVKSKDSSGSIISDTSSSYVQPASGYGVPASSYNAPSSSYNAPASSYNAPSPSYNAPAPSYSAPASSYDAPKPSYSAPAPSYNVPLPSYSAPSSSYVQPGASFVESYTTSTTAPFSTGLSDVGHYLRTSFDNSILDMGDFVKTSISKGVNSIKNLLSSATSSLSSGSDSSSSGYMSSSFVIPSSSYGSPSSSYDTPSSSYKAPSSSYNAPSSSYNAPSSSYNAPSSSYNAPSSSYKSPSTQDSSSSYGSPSSSDSDFEYGSPLASNSIGPSNFKPSKDITSSKTATLTPFQQTFEPMPSNHQTPLSLDDVTFDSTFGNEDHLIPIHHQGPQFNDEPKALPFVHTVTPTPPIFPTHPIANNDIHSITPPTFSVIPTVHHETPSPHVHTITPDSQFFVTDPEGNEIDDEEEVPLLLTITPSPHSIATHPTANDDLTLTPFRPVAISPNAFPSPPVAFGIKNTPPIKFETPASHGFTTNAFNSLPLHPTAPPSTQPFFTPIPLTQGFGQNDETSFFQPSFQSTRDTGLHSPSARDVTPNDLGQLTQSNTDSPPPTFSTTTSSDSPSETLPPTFSTTTSTGTSIETSPSKVSAIPTRNDIDRRPIVFFDITVNGEPAGTLFMELFNETVPKTAANFKALATGEAGPSFTGSKFHRVLPGLIMQGGDITNGDGTGQVSIFGGKFEDESFAIPHDSPGLLSMANEGPDSNGSQFFITMTKLNKLDGKNVVFGRVYDETSFALVESLNLEFGSEDGKPKAEILIANSGEFDEQHQVKRIKK